MISFINRLNKKNLSLTFAIVILVYVIVTVLPYQKYAQPIQINGPKSPHDIQVDSENNLIYIANEDPPKVTVIDVKSNKVIKVIPLPIPTNSSSSIHIVIDPDTKLLYATNSNIIYVIDLTTNKISNIAWPFPINDLVIDHVHKRIYIADSSGISLLEGTNNNVIKKVARTEDAKKIAINFKSDMIYSLNRSDDKITVIDGKTNNIVSVALPINAYSLSINPSTNMIYVVSKDANRVAIINGSTNMVTKTLIIPSSGYRAAARPDIIAFSNIQVANIVINSQTNTLYITNFRTNSICVIDGQNNRVVKSISVDRPTATDINPTNSMMYIISLFTDYVTIIDGKTNTVITKTYPDVGSPLAGINIKEGTSEGIAVNPNTNKIYVADKYKGISVIDGNTDKEIKNINLGDAVCDLHINPNINRIYADLCLSDIPSISVIDGNKNSEIFRTKIKDLWDIAVNTADNSVVALTYGGNYSAILILDNLTKNVLNKSVIVNPPFLLGTYLVVDSLMDKIYVEDNLKGIVYAIGLRQSRQYATVIGEVQVGEYPGKMAINPNTAILYVINRNSHTVSAIDEYTHHIIEDIKVGIFPNGIDVDPITNRIYVANEHSYSVSVIDGNTNHVVDNIQVGKFPVRVGVNPNNNIVYAANDDSDTVSVIDGKKDNVLVGVNLNINPSNSSYLACNGKRISNNEYVRYPIGTTLECQAVSNNGFAFGSWSGDLSSNLNDTSKMKLLVYKYGNLTANFIQVPSPTVQFTIPPETLFSILLIMITAIVGWLIPNIASLINKRKQKQYLIIYTTSINSLHDQYGQNKINKEKYLQDLEFVRKRIATAFSEGKIDTSNYEILDKKVSSYRDDVVKT